MARTKKELKDQAPVEEQVVGEGIGLSGEALQPDSGEQDGNPSGGLADLELANTKTLDPDAPQTEMEGAGDVGQAAGPILPPDPESGASDSTFPQTGLESDMHAVAEGGHPQTETELASEGQAPGDGGPGADGTPLPEGVVPPFYMSPQESGAPVVETTGTGQAEAPGQAESGDGPDQTETTRSRLRMPRQRGPRVVSIDAERTVETESDRLRSDLLDLVESFKGKKILTGTIQGVERLASNPDICYAVTYHGDFKIIIPVLDAIEEPEDYRDQPKGDVLHYLLNKRLGAEVDYIVKRIDQEGGVVAANRLEAMALKRREYYFRTDRDGNYQIYEGIRAEARVVSVIRAGIFVDLFGAECYIPLRELSYQRWVDAASHYQPGQRVLVKVLEVDRSDRNKPRVTASVKQASENPYEKALKKYAVGNRYVGTVSLVDLSGVFVSLDGGIDCLCTHPKRGRPPRGARVTVRILGINNDTNRIWGVITHMSTTR
ncbi:30S ribosomal protein S1 [bacterium 1xD42-67]|nr:30S ribosomal protein S1 [bacterium 1xD42-67]